MRRENRGLDPSISLVPSGSGGWGKKMTLGQPQQSDPQQAVVEQPTPAPKAMAPQNVGRSQGHGLVAHPWRRGQPTGFERIPYARRHC